MVKLKTIILLIYLLLQNVTLYSQWEAVGNVGGEITDFSVVDASTLWAVYGTSVFLSINSGANFTTIQGPFGPQFFAVWGRNSTTCFVGDAGSIGYGGGNAKVWKTTNSGLNWQNVFSTGGNHGFINDIVFSRSNPLLGIIFSDPPNGPGAPVLLAKTVDGGGSWNVENAPSSTGLVGSVNSAMCIDAQFYGYGLNGYGLIRITTNGGVNWLAQSLNLGNAYVSTLAFNNDKSIGIGGIFSIGSGQLISRTTNTGANWTPQDVGMSGPTTCKWIQGTSICYLSRSGIMKSTNNGSTWIIMTTQGVNDIRFMDFYKSGSDIYGYAVSLNGVVLKLIDNVIGTKQISSTITNEFSFHQNYPNPFNPITRISFSVPLNKGGERGLFVRLIIYDVLGREVTTLVNEQLKPGIYGVEWDGTNYPSGVYFYQLRTDEYVETRKMVLIK